MSLKPGKYLGKIVDHGLFRKESVNADGTKSVKGSAVVTFQFEDENKNPKNMNWFGSFTGGARPITVETLVRLGLTVAPGQLHRELKPDGSLPAIVLNTTDEFELDIQLQPNPKKNNQPEPRIAFVNVPGGSNLRASITKQEVDVLIGGLNLGADFAQARAKLGIKAVPAAEQAAVQMAMTDDDIPF